MVLDCIASGTVWVDMKKTGVDVVISAPQKGWTVRAAYYGWNIRTADSTQPISAHSLLLTKLRERLVALLFKCRN